MTEILRIVERRGGKKPPLLEVRCGNCRRVYQRCEWPGRIHATIYCRSCVPGNFTVTKDRRWCTQCGFPKSVHDAETHPFVEAGNIETLRTFDDWARSVARESCFMLQRVRLAIGLDPIPGLKWTQRKGPCRVETEEETEDTLEEVKA